jgi:hypothetical protein
MKTLTLNFFYYLLQTNTLMAVFQWIYEAANYVDVIAKTARSQCGRSCDVTPCSDVRSIPADQSATREYCRLQSLLQSFGDLLRQLRTLVSPDSLPSLQPRDVPVIQDGTNAIQIPFQVLAAVAKEMVVVRNVLKENISAVGQH